MKRAYGMCMAILAVYLLGGCGQSSGFVYSGTIEGTEIPVQSELAGTVRVLAAAEGQLVRAGEQLARLDEQQLQLQVSEGQAAVEAVEAKWEEAKAGSRSEELAQAVAQWEQARKVTEQAQARVQSAGEQVTSQLAVKEQLSGDLTSARETMRYHEKRMNQMRNAYDNGEATQEQLDGMKEAFNQAKMQVTNLEARIKATEAQIAQADHEKAAKLLRRSKQKLPRSLPKPSWRLSGREAQTISFAICWPSSSKQTASWLSFRLRPVRR